MHYHLVFIAYQTKLNLQICDYAPDENFYTHLNPRRKAVNFSAVTYFVLKTKHISFSLGQLVEINSIQYIIVVRLLL